MTDFEKKVTKLRSRGDIEGKHFDISEWENGKMIEIRPPNLGTEWIYFKYDKNGKFLGQY